MSALASGRDYAPKVPKASVDQFVTFTSNGTFYGVEIMAVREIRSWQPTTPLPQRPAGACGVLDIRGSIIEVYDLGMLLGGGAIVPQPTNVVLVLAFEDESVGLLVESVSDIIQIETDSLMNVPSDGQGTAQLGVASMVNHEGRLVGILNLPALFPRWS